MYHSHDRVIDVLEFYERVTTELRELLTDNPHPVFPRDAELRKLIDTIRVRPLSKERFFEAFHEIIKHSVKLYSPYYFGHMDSGVLQEFGAVDAVISFLNQNLLSWELSPLASLIEQQVIEELGGLFGLPRSRGGTFVSGGTLANLTGLLLALRSKYPDSREEGIPSGPHEIFVSEQAHYSIEKAASIIGLGINSVKHVKTDNVFRVDLEDLEHKLEEASNPLAVIGIAGTTSTGSFDDLEQLKYFAKKFGTWFHVDAAYGGALVFHSEKRELLRGIEKADSIAFDPHKWLWAPKSTAVLLVRERKVLQTFNHFAPYIPVHGEQEELIVNYGKQTIQGSRRFDALRVWVLTRFFDEKFIEKSINQTLELTKELTELIVRSQVFDLVLVPQSTITCFKIKEELIPERVIREQIVTRVHKLVEKSGVGWISLTHITGEKVLRFVILNLNSSRRVIHDVFKFIESISLAEIDALRSERGENA